MGQKKSFDKAAILLALLFALLSAMLAVLLLARKTYRPTVIGTYQTASFTEEAGFTYLTFCKDGNYFHYTGKTLYESGTFAETDTDGVFRLTRGDGTGSRQVLALEDGTLCFAQGDDLQLYRLASKIPSFVRDKDAAWDYDENQHPVNLPPFP